MTHRSENLQPSLFEAERPRVELRAAQKSELATAIDNQRYKRARDAHNRNDYSDSFQCISNAECAIEDFDCAATERAIGKHHDSAAADHFADLAADLVRIRT